MPFQFLFVFSIDPQRIHVTATATRMLLICASIPAIPLHYQKKKKGEKERREKGRRRRGEKKGARKE